MESFCTPAFIPSYSCCLNEPIEATWAVLKQKVLPVFTKLSIRNKASRKNCIEAVWREIARIDGQTYLNLMRIHYGYLQELLESAPRDYRLPMPYK